MEECELYKLIEFLVDIDLSFVIKDIIGPNFEDIEIPSNVDEDNYTIEVNTPQGPFVIHYINKEDNKAIKFMHYFGDKYYEEYRFELNPDSENYLQLEGRTVELREKGMILNNIHKKYFPMRRNKIIDLWEINRTTKVFTLSALGGPRRNFSRESLASIGYIRSDGYEIYRHGNVYEKQISISSLPIDYLHQTYLSGFEVPRFPSISIDGNANYFGYLKGKDNVVGKTYDLFDGIVTEENYAMANKLIKEGYFNCFFAHFDYRKTEGAKTINEIIDELIGPGLPNYKREYSTYTKKLVQEYYDYLQEEYLSDEYKKEEIKKLQNNKVIDGILNDIHLI